MAARNAQRGPNSLLEGLKGFERPSTGPQPKPIVTPREDPSTLAKGATGLGRDALARLAGELGKSVVPMSGKLPADKSPLGVFIPPVPVAVPTPVYSCSLATYEFLRHNLPRPTDLEEIQLNAFEKFDPSLGCHDLFFSCAPGTGPKGRWNLADNQVLIVLSFEAFAGVSNPGLPGSHVEICRTALLGNVCFHLLAGNGLVVRPESTTVAGVACSGTELVNTFGHDGHFHGISDVVRTSVRAVYEVISPPFPGFPKFVGARLTGYLMSSVLFEEIFNSGCPIG